MISDDGEFLGFKRVLEMLYSKVDGQKLSSECTVLELS